MNTLVQTDKFSDWLVGLKDNIAKAWILSKIKLAELRNFGDSEPVGSRVSEMKVDVGAGYRIYYAQNGKTVYLHLSGGNKSIQKKILKGLFLCGKD
jgi:putative addiction module killer protein